MQLRSPDPVLEHQGTVFPDPAPPRRPAMRLRWLLPYVVVGVAAAAVGGAVVFALMHSTGPAAGRVPVVAAEDRPIGGEDHDDLIELAASSQAAAGIVVEPVQASPLVETIRLTGRVELNEDRLAHIYPLVEGRVHSVLAHYGQAVRRGDLLAVVQSREVGQARLDVVRTRLALTFARTRYEWEQQIATNMQALLSELEARRPIEEIEPQFRERPLGDLREPLLTAYVNAQRQQIELERQERLVQGGTGTDRELLAARATRGAAWTTFQALMEQARFQTRQSLMAAEQALREAETRVLVDESALKILGVDAELSSPSETDLDTQPAADESLAWYRIVAPFDGTVIRKDMALMEQVRPDRQLLEIADLSTVWIKADLYEQHLPLLGRLQDQTIAFRSRAWPERVFRASVFYAGEIVDEATRTVPVTASAANDEGLLKPGMFVEVELPALADTDVVQVPESAVMQHAGQNFVFVAVGTEAYQRRDVVAGRRGDGTVEIVTGVQAGEQVVTQGAFVLKSRMLADLLEEE